MAFVFEKDPVTGYQHPAIATVPFRAEPQEVPFTDAQMLAALTTPLAQMLPRSAQSPAQRAEALRLLCIQLPGAVGKGGALDETNPAGRAALLDEINARCGVPPG